MKFLGLLSVLFFVSTVFGAESTVSLRGRKVSLLGDGTKASLVDITSDLKKQKIGLTPETSRLVRLELKVKAAPTGAIFALMLDGSAVDSSSLADDQVKTITLTADSGSTPQPWVIGIRGSAEILEMKVTVDAAGTEPLARPTAPATPSEPTTPPPETNVPPLVITPQSSDTDVEILKPGQRIIIVSKTSGNIDYGTISRFNSITGKYVVLYEGKEYLGFERPQLGLLSGCENGLCVSDKVRRDSETVIIRGRLPNGSWIVESSENELSVADATELRKPQTPAKVPPAQQYLPRRQSQIQARTFYPGQLVLYVQPNGRTQALNLVQENEGMLTLSTFSGLSQTVPDDSRVAVFAGCENTFCVGDQILTMDRNGMQHQGVIIAMQSTAFVVIRLMDFPTDLGNWPLRSLRHIN